MKALVVMVALIGILFWNLPATNSSFKGQHSFYTEVDCTKCHLEQTNYLTHTSTLNHTMTCKICHPQDRMSSHSARRGSCYVCHYTIPSVVPSTVLVDAGVTETLTVNSDPIQIQTSPT